MAGAISRLLQSCQFLFCLMKNHGCTGPLEKGFVTKQDFREFTFTNAAILHTRNNPGFFKGTVVEQAGADELGLERTSPAATA